MSVAGLAPGALPAPLHGHARWWRHALAFALLCVACIAAMAVDARTFQGVNVWMKPAKFAISISVYLATLAWMARWVPASLWDRGTARFATWLALGTAWAEMLYILLMASRAEASHFNVSSPLTQTAYSLMGLGAVSLTAVSPWLTWQILRAQTHWRRDPLLLSVVLGGFLTFALGAGFGGYLGSAESHWVQAPATDAGGVPVFGWTRDGGDLRVAHFFGLHAMQALPLFAWLVVRTIGAGIAARVGVWAFALVYSGATIVTFVQAVQGQPFLP